MQQNLTTNRDNSENNQKNGSNSQNFRRALVLFINFFLIILAYYHIKPASRSFFIEQLGADRLPYVWIATALVLGIIIGYYNRLVANHDRLHVVFGTSVVTIGLLILFRNLLGMNSAVVAVAFYIFVDIFSVVLVEQLWSLADTVHTSSEGKRWYGIIGTGGLIGGVAGGAISAVLLEHTGLHTRDLLLVAAGILFAVLLLNLVMGRMGIYREVHTPETRVVSGDGWRSLLTSRYLLLVAGILLLAQMAQPLVEYKFIKMVEASYQGLDERTVFLSAFFSVLGIVSIGVNLVLTPLILRYLGIMGGLLVQPVALFFCTFAYYVSPTITSGSVMKISDRGLSYSINRASKELLYVPIDPVRTYQAKAWIDMFGYRMFKVFGSLLILLLTQWLPWQATAVQLSWLTMGVCVVWVIVIAYLAQAYRIAVVQPASA